MRGAPNKAVRAETGNTRSYSNGLAMCAFACSLYELARNLWHFNIYTYTQRRTKADNKTHRRFNTLCFVYVNAWIMFCEINYYVLFCLR
jgi:hypothetical protein